MKKINMKPISLMIMGAALLTGCAATQKAEERFSAEEKMNEKRFDSSYIKSSAAAVANDDVNKTNNFSKTTRNWIDPTPLPRSEAKPALPEFFKKNISMTMPGTVNAIEVLSEMQRSTGIRFEINQDIYDTTPAVGKIITAGASSGAQTQKPGILQIPDFVFRGTLEDALNLFSSKANVSWKWTGKEILVYKFETKTYNIAALAGVTKTSANVDLKGDTGGSAAGGEGGGSSSAAGAGNSSVGRTSSLTTWEEVKVYLISQLSPVGNMAVLEAAGAVTIKDVPSVHKNIEKSIEDLNALLSKQIYLNVDIYSVSMREGDQTAIDWNLVWQNSSNKLGFTNSNTTSSASSNFSIGVLKGPFSGSGLIARTLSSVGKTSLINQFQVTTLNGQPTPIASNKKEAYIKEIKVSQSTSTSGTSTQPQYELKTADVSAGINLNVIPKIQPNGNILLEYAMNLSDVEAMPKYDIGSDGAFIQLPVSNLKSVLQRATLRSGQTLVLSGFKQTSTTTGKSGVGSPNNMALGGKNEASLSDQYLVITVTPYIANSNSYFKN